MLAFIKDLKKVFIASKTIKAKKGQLLYILFLGFPNLYSAQSKDKLK
jgi:hypothetical protein